MQLAVSPSVALELHRSLGRSVPVPMRGRVSPVRRRLFDDDDSGDDVYDQERRCAAERQLDAIRLEQKRRWNFDFVGERPLPGRFQWRRAGAHDAHGAHRTALKRPYSAASACPALKAPRTDVRVWALDAPFDNSKTDAADAADVNLRRR